MLRRAPARHVTSTWLTDTFRLESLVRPAVLSTRGGCRGGSAIQLWFRATMRTRSETPDALTPQGKQLGSFPIAGT